MSRAERAAIYPTRHEGGGAGAGRGRTQLWGRLSEFQRADSVTPYMLHFVLYCWGGGRERRDIFVVAFVF